jgi:hypothetical protein
VTVLIDANSISLSRGSHRPGQRMVCLMEVVVSLLNRERFSDRPACACPVVAGFARAVNASLSDGERMVLWPFALRLGSTRANHATTVRRALRMMDFAVREVLPLVLELDRFDEHARWLRGLAPINDGATVGVAYRTVEDISRSIVDHCRDSSNFADAATLTARDALDAARAGATVCAELDAGYEAGCVVWNALAACDAAAEAGHITDNANARAQLINMSVNLLDELCPPGSSADVLAALNWGAVKTALCDVDERPFGLHSAA